MVRFCKYIKNKGGEKSAYVSTEQKSYNSSFQSDDKAARFAIGAAAT